LAKNLKLNIKNTQLAKAAGLDKIKDKLAKPKKDKEPEPEVVKPVAPPEPVAAEELSEAEAPRRIRAKTKSSFGPKDAKDSAETTGQGLDASEAPSVTPPLPASPFPQKPGEERLGPTGRHVNDLLRKAQEQKQQAHRKKEEASQAAAAAVDANKQAPARKVDKPQPASPHAKPKVEKETTEDADKKGGLNKGKKVRDFKDVRPAKKGTSSDRGFDARDRAGLRESDDERWRKRRGMKSGHQQEEQVIRPTELKIRLPITVKDLAAEMKLKSSQLIQKLFLQNMIYTLNDYLDDGTTVEYLGQEFGCTILIDTTEERRIQITDISVAEEISKTPSEELVIRPPVVAFMGHVDHGKTSLIDAIRKSNIASGEAGAITQHMGAFMCHTPVGDLTVLDTPGHEAFSAMRARGAEVTDIIVLVVAGDEGLREQTREAIAHAKAAEVTIVVAINKCDKPNFDPDTVYRQLAEIELLPEKWGGQTITVNTSATTGAGIQELLEMLALQAEVMELRANPQTRARGTVLESELHKGMGCVATILVQNGELRLGDAVVFESHYGRIKTMQNEHGKQLERAGPSHPVEITGLSGLPSAGDPFIVVKSEKEAKEIVEAREVGRIERQMRQRKAMNIDHLLAVKADKKILNLILRGDVQGSIEALKASIMKIESTKAEPNIIFTGVGEISESDIQLAAASHAVILGFHTGIEAHAESLVKELGVTVRQHDIIYHAIDDVKRMMTGLLDKIEEEKETGTAEVRALFKSSQLGTIAGCMITDGTIMRHHRVRVLRAGEVVWKGVIHSLKRVKEDVKEVKKGFECGIVLQGFSAVQEGDILQAYELIYRSQEL